MDSGVIRRANNLDLLRIIDLERSCFGDGMAYNSKQIKYLITHANSNCLVETYDEVIRGFLVVLYKRGACVAGIETISVDNQYRGKGIGRRLLFASEEDMSTREIKKIRLEVSIGNSSAVKLYEKSGYRITNILKNYYYFKHYGTYDAYRMVKELTT